MSAQVAVDLRAAADAIEQSDPEASWASDNGPAWWIVYHLRVEEKADWHEVIAALRAAADRAEAAR
jgi:hypothetical protein